MKMELNERDKKLLVFLSIFVIVVGIGYWGIFGTVKKMNKINDQIEEEQALKDLNEMKILMLPDSELLCADLEDQIATAKDNFFPMMSNDEIDKYFTGLVLDYKLYAYDLDIRVSDELAKLVPYQYSQLAAELAAEETASGSKESDEAVNEDFADDIVGVREATITLRVGGEEADIKKLINDLSNNDKMIRVVNFAWSEERNLVYGEEEGDYEVETTKVLNITVEIYMCEE